MPNRPLWLALKTLRANASKVLDATGVRAPVDVFALIRQLGIHLFFSEETLAGACHISDGNAHIWVKKSDPLVRQRFTAAHELGHVILHEQTLFHDLVMVAGHDPQEQEANKFAYELLMPDWQVRVIAPQTKGSIPQMARYFGVPETAMEIRFGQVYGNT